jgi:putative oxygen-independent coproporphyrinogen III oxidase
MISASPSAPASARAHPGLGATAATLRRVPAPVDHHDRRPFGVYVHVPFCARRCDYCAFATWTDRDHLVDGYLGSVRIEVERAIADGMPPASSVFFGGGTPSLVPAAGLMAVLSAIPRAPGAEVTVECNPDTVSDDLLAAYLAGGVNRLSFGVQSLVDHVLVSLGRTHDVANVEKAVCSARRVGFESFNLDLIYGGVGESIADWQTTLDRLGELDPPHVSAYALTVEAGTPLAADPTRHPEDDDQADKYQLAESMLGGAGYEWYEISNWSRPGHQCRHNLLYWRQQDYRGFGCAAHSHGAGRRWWNVRTPERYVEAIQAGRSAEAGFEELDVETQRLERLQLALRTSEGVPVDALALDDPALGGLIDVRAGQARLTVSGRMLANEVAIRLR